MKTQERVVCPSCTRVTAFRRTAMKCEDGKWRACTTTRPHVCNGVTYTIEVVSVDLKVN